jgi:hypothetical protein
MPNYLLFIFLFYVLNLPTLQLSQLNPLDFEYLYFPIFLYNEFNHSLARQLFQHRFLSLDFQFLLLLYLIKEIHP